MTIGIVLLTLCVVIGVVVFLLDYTEKGHYTKPTLSECAATGFKWFAVPAAVVGVVWFIVAVPYSTFEHNSCRVRAEGYGLDYHWSIRNDCRIYLPTGQLVPDDKIRITSDGQIVAGGEG